MNIVDGEPGVIARFMWWFWNKIHPEPIIEDPQARAEYRALMESKGFHFEDTNEE